MRDGARRVGDWSLDGARDAVDQLLGIIALAGIVINNAIVLIDRIGIDHVQGQRGDRVDCTGPLPDLT